MIGLAMTRGGATGVLCDCSERNVVTGEGECASRHLKETGQLLRPFSMMSRLIGFPLYRIMPYKYSERLKCRHVVTCRSQEMKRVTMEYMRLLE